MLDDYVARHKNSVAVIVASGPSICEVDFRKVISKFDNVVVICVNMGVLAVESPDYFYFTDGASVNSLFFAEATKKASLSLVGCKFNPEDLLHQRIRLHVPEARFIARRASDNCSFLFDDGLLVRGFDAVHSATHLAFVMGCAAILLYGVDLCKRRDGLDHFVDDRRYYPEVYESISNGDKYGIATGMRVIKSVVMEGVTYDIQANWYYSYREWLRIKYANPEVRIYSQSEQSLLKSMFPFFKM